MVVSRKMREAGDSDGCVRKEPHFFKVILEGSREKLMIPPAFAHHIEKESSRAILESPVVKNWPVELVHDGNGLVFRNGWKEFFNLHSLEVGDFLVFRYDGNMHFTVRVFGKSCCEYNYALIEEHTDAIGRIRQPVRMPSQHPARDYSEACENVHHVENLNLFSGNDIAHTHRKIVKKPDVGVSMKTRQLLSENDSFKVVMKRWGGRVQSNVYVPVGFTKKIEELAPSFKASRGKVMEIDLYNVSDPSAEACKVHIIPRKSKETADAYKICGGWLKFCKINKLKYGDVCTFELDRERSRINVYISRYRPK
ncbi:B3 domain-containing protein Os12g0591400-like [Nymphaea colorata]|nr:B3 domain-containing protein Os12g0591400-like [Nymphaea colorata]